MEIRRPMVTDLAVPRKPQTKMLGEQTNLDRIRHSESGRGVGTEGQKTEVLWKSLVKRLDTLPTRIQTIHNQKPV